MHLLGMLPLEILHFLADTAEIPGAKAEDLGIGMSSLRQALCFSREIRAS